MKLRMPKMFNLRRDPFERADDNSNTYWDWQIFARLSALRHAGRDRRRLIENFVKYPPRQKAAASQSGRGDAEARRRERRWSPLGRLYHGI